MKCMRGFLSVNTNCMTPGWLNPQEAELLVQRDDYIVTHSLFKGQLCVTGQVPAMIPSMKEIGKGKGKGKEKRGMGSEGRKSALDFY